MATYELHVWGPAFGLPSIDAECNAAIAYLSLVCDEGQWVVVADHEHELSPSKDYPALRHDGDWVGGFRQIVRRLEKMSSKAQETSTKSRLSAGQFADSIAYASFIESHAAPLLDLSLYTTHQNYYHTTSPAWTAILPWHKNYTIPPARRAAARARTAHFGLGSLDVEEIDEGPELGESTSISGSYERKKQEAGVPAQRAGANVERESLLPLGRSKGIMSYLSKPEYTTKFRLTALVSDFLIALSDLLGRKKYLLTDEEEGPSSLDCLALGYLSLMLYPPLPQSWLSETIKSRFPRIHQYTRRLHADLLGAEYVKASDVLSLSSLRNDSLGLVRARKELDFELPWAPPPSESVLDIGAGIGKGIARSIPVIKEATAPDPLKALPPEAAEDLDAELHEDFPSKLATTIIAGATCFISLLTGAAYYQATSPRHEDLVFERPRHMRGGGSNTSHFTYMGEAGEALAALSRQMDFDRQWAREMDSQRLGGVSVGSAKLDFDVEAET